MKYLPYEVAIMGLQEIGRNDLIYFLDNPYSQSSALTNPNKIPHFDSGFIGMKDIGRYMPPKVTDMDIRVPYIQRRYSCSHLHSDVTDIPHIPSHADKIVIKNYRLYATVEDLALVERAMFLAFKFAGIPYDCPGCESQFNNMGVRLTKESDIL